MSAPTPKRLSGLRGQRWIVVGLLNPVPSAQIRAAVNRVLTEHKSPQQGNPLCKVNNFKWKGNSVAVDLTLLRNASGELYRPMRLDEEIPDTVTLTSAYRVMAGGRKLQSKVAGLDELGMIMSMRNAMGPDIVLRPGMKGYKVGELQMLLNGWLNVNNIPLLAADGDFGKKTVAAVKLFQLNSKLAADAVVGPKTWLKLRSFYA